MRFETTLFQMGNNTGIEVPAEVEGAKADDTRRRRVKAIVAKLVG